MNSLEIKARASSVRLNQQQRDIIVGLLLGDGHLETKNHGRTYRLKIEHSINQKEYVDWQYAIFKNHTRTGPKLKVQMVNGKQYQKYYFSTIATGSLRFYGQQFYPHGKKCVPKFIGKMLEPQGLAVWFMDDGSYKSKQHRSLILNTQGFVPQDIVRLQKVLQEKFSIETVRRKQKEGEQIYIPGKQVPGFIQKIKPYILPSMEYKIRLTSLPKL